MICSGFFPLFDYRLFSWIFHKKSETKKANHLWFAFEEASRGFEPLMRIFHKEIETKKANHGWFAFEEASRGFEPLMRILQTLALPLGHDAILLNEKYWLNVANHHSLVLSGRWDSNPRPSPWQGDVLPLYYARISWLNFSQSAETQDRTGDTTIFSRVLYQLSYLGKTIFCKAVVILHVLI